MKLSLLTIVLLGLLVLAACSKETPPIGTGIGGGQSTEEPPEACFCTALYQPVCGSDGKTYSNSCFAGCAQVDYVDGACA